MVTLIRQGTAVASWLASGAIAVAGCQPEFDDRASMVTDLRVLAVRSDPAEGPPGTIIQYTALVGDPSGSRNDVAIEWAYCTVPKPVSENNDVSSKCFSAGDFIQPFGQNGQSVTGNIPLVPQNACNQFGPDLPDTMGKPPGRPADPDSTGGYYQPVRLAVNRGNHYDFTIGETRISCNLPGASADVFIDYRKRYRRNQGPEIARVLATPPSGAIELTSEDQGLSGLVVPRGGAVRLSASWPECPATPACGNGFCEALEDATSCPVDCTAPKGCGGAEAYVYFDLATRTLVDRRESMRISWYASGGYFVDDRTGRTEGEADLTVTENTWTAPPTAGLVTLWIVLRDSRGGLAWKTYRVAVE